LVDLLVAAIIAATVLAISPGLGVVAWFGLPLLLLGIIWLVVERRRSGRASRARRALQQ
jgi:hypothetical protein